MLGDTLERTAPMFNYVVGGQVSCAGLRITRRPTPCHPAAVA
jgi:hypothetical protein